MLLQHQGSYILKNNDLHFLLLFVPHKEYTCTWVFCFIFFFSLNHGFSLFISFSMLNILSIWVPLQKVLTQAYLLQKAFSNFTKTTSCFSLSHFHSIFVAPSSLSSLPTNTVMCTLSLATILWAPSGTGAYSSLSPTPPSPITCTLLKFSEKKRIP